MKTDTLRDYQQEMLDRLHEAWGRHRSVMVQMPTGTGKTVLLAEVIREESRGGFASRNKEWRGAGGGAQAGADRTDLADTQQVWH